MEGREATEGGIPAFGEEVTDEEIREVLSSLGDADDGEDPPPVLLLAARPEDERRLSAALEGRDVSVATASSAHLAFELFRAHPYSAVVACRDALPEDGTRFLERLRDVDPSIRLVVLQDPEERPLPDPVRTVWRPLTPTALEAALEFPPGAPAGIPAASQPEPVREPAHRERARVPRGSVEPLQGPIPESVSRAEPLRAVQALLEAKVAGQSVDDGLRRWAEADPAIHALVEWREGAESEFRVRGGEQENRRRALGRLLEQLGPAGETPRQPEVRGPFTVFPPTNGGERATALLHADSAAAREALAGLLPFLPLIEKVSFPAAAGDAGAARARFIALLESRMRSAQRGDGRLGILVLEGVPGEDSKEIGRVLRGLLRGGDWVEPAGERTYAILDRSEGEVFSALGERLRGLPNAARMRVVALGWQPGDGDAAQLVGRAERLLDTSGRGDLLFGQSRGESSG